MRTKSQPTRVSTVGSIQGRHATWDSKVKSDIQPPDFTGEQVAASISRIRKKNN